MTEAVNLGLDFGSLGLRAAYVAGEAVVSLPSGADWDDPAQWLMGERSPAAALGIHFPSVKSRLGMDSAAADDDADRATETVRNALVGLHARAAEHAGRPPGQLVVAVPALYSAARRVALRDLALAAGFADVHLLNDSMAAVIGHTHRREDPLTALVYNLGYSGFEVGLVRLAKGRYWAIAYDGASSPGGATFDLVIMRGCLQVLTKQHLWSPGSDLSYEEWLKLRGFATQLKEMLSDSETVELGLGVTGTARQVLHLALSRQEFEQAISDSVQSSLDAAERLLEDANLSAADLSEVLLLGGGARIGLVQRMIAERFAHQPTIPATNLLAQGAAIYAARLGTLPTSETTTPRAEEPQAAEASVAIPVLKISLSSGGEEESGDGRPEQAATLSGAKLLVRPEVVLTLTPPATQRKDRIDAPVSDASMSSMAADRERLFQYTRLLIDQGSYISARGFLEGLVQDARTMLDTIPSRPSLAAKYEVEQALRRSHELLQAGRFQQAIELAHYAYAVDTENPQVFEQMIGVHCHAAMAHSSMEGYKKSIEWLMCAHGHDRTNTEIHDRIAERHFIHAQQLAEHDRNAEALKALEECQYFNPEHEGAKKLQGALAHSG